MAKKVRFNGDVSIFGSGALGTERTIFGEVTQSDLINDQLTADFIRGWGIVGVNDLPTKQDFNACAYTLSYLVSYLYQFGVAEWKATADYHINCVQNYNGVLYTSLQDNNTNHIPTATLGVWWTATAGTAGDMFKVDNLSGLANYTTARTNMGVLQRQGSSIAAAATTSIGGADSHFIFVTGNTTITAFGTGTVRDWVCVEFTGTPTITHNAVSLILPGGQNINATAGDTAIFARIGSAGADTWVCLSYTRANGQAVSDFGARTNIASAATTTLTQATNAWTVTGTATITALGSTASIANAVHLLTFSGILTFTHNATSLILPGAANITTAAGDTAIMEYLGSGNWKCLDFVKASGYAVTREKFSNICGRLSPSTGVAVPNTDVTGAGTIYFTPHNGLQIPIYNGTTFVMTDIAAELSNILANGATGNAGAAACANNSNYDLFVWLNGTTPTLTRAPLWTSDTARGAGAGTSELATIMGIQVNAVALSNGPGANLGTYVGSIRTNGTATVDVVFGAAAAANGSNARIGIWNRFNRVSGFAASKDSTDSWTYTTTSYRAYNNSNSNRITFIRGLDIEAVNANFCPQSTATATGSDIGFGIGIDSVTVMTSGVDCGATAANKPAGFGIPYCGLLGLGQHYIQALEFGGTNNVNAGDGGGTKQQSGLYATFNW